MTLAMWYNAAGVRGASDAARHTDSALDTYTAGARKEWAIRMSTRRKLSTNEKIFYAISLLIILSMVLSMIYVAISPQRF